MDRKALLSKYTIEQKAEILKNATLKIGEVESNFSSARRQVVDLLSILERMQSAGIDTATLEVSLKEFLDSNDRLRVILEEQKRMASDDIHAILEESEKLFDK